MSVRGVSSIGWKVAGLVRLSRVAIILLACVPAHRGTATQTAAQEGPRSIRISIQVSAENGLDGRIKSYLAREFRKIGDVVVTDSAPVYRIGCVAFQSKTTTGVPLGYTLSVAVTSTMPATLTNAVAKAKLAPDDAGFIERVNTNDGVLVFHQVQSCNAQGLQRTCAEFAAQFDGSLIESARQFAQSYAESIPAEPTVFEPAVAPTNLLTANADLPAKDGAMPLVEELPPAVSTALPGERFPEMRKQLLTPADVRNWSPEDMQYAINEVFARHGFHFGNAESRAAFVKASWYKPNPALQAADVERNFSVLEAANVKLVGSLRNLKRDSKRTP